MLVVDDEVVEDAHHWDDDRIRRLLEDRHARRTVPVLNLEDAARFLSQSRRRQHQGGGRRQQMALPDHVSSRKNARGFAPLWVQLTRWQDTPWPGAISRKTGLSILQRSSASGQRVWKVQPGGGLIGLGTSPCSRRFSRRSFGFGTGTADRSAWV